MRKLKLEVESLQVESFEAASPAIRAGTVHARHEPYNDDPGSTDCDGGGFFSIFGTCAPDYTCGTCVTWRPTCPASCLSCPDIACTAGT